MRRVLLCVFAWVAPLAGIVFADPPFVFFETPANRPDCFRMRKGFAATGRRGVTSMATVGPICLWRRFTTPDRSRACSCEMKRESSRSIRKSTCIRPAWGAVRCSPTSRIAGDSICMSRIVLMERRAIRKPIPHSQIPTSFFGMMAAVSSPTSRRRAARARPFMKDAVSRRSTSMAMDCSTC